MELLLIRHARPMRLYAAQGQPDPDLDAEGTAQAEAVAAALAGEPLVAIWSSPLRRAQQTAEPLARRHGLTPVLDDGLRELTVGEDSYVPIEARGPATASSQDMLNEWLTRLHSDEGRALVAAFRGRVSSAVDRIVAAQPHGVVAVVCHGGVINAVLTEALGLEALMTFHPDYTSVSRVLVGRSGRRHVASVNEHAHVRALEQAARAR
ncbi:histidine phosphatase family protein [Pseudonocardia sp.]|jgi:probable phosphoglycerate mutase|uniref:histidine phosphatase family protein n=1 Tax=Pseudonocardia sp. TaxID=60912 RepID=UPI0026338FA6|nr:histidine phosphatase family protein [Pseudonocardia sp.]MCW2717319.1 putative phosphoglycerate mutase family protein [Pseudonocardia sp.]